MSAVELRDRVLHVAVSHADRGASLNSDALDATVQALRGDDVGCVLLHGAGSNFCTGGDVTAFAAAEDPARAVGEMATAFHEFLQALTGPVPVVAAVTGWAAGAGMSTALAADVIVGGPGTRLRPAYPSIGFSPDGGMSWHLPRIIGLARARDVLLTDQVVDGEQALAWGMLTRLVDDDEIGAVATDLAARLAHGPTGSHSSIKALLRDGAERTLSDHLPHEADAIARCAGSADGREGVRAFRERRPPEFGVRR